MGDVSRFISGFRRFQKHYLGRGDNLLDRLVTEGQRPKALFIACCDSRTDPALITDCDPGDMFVVRNVANLVPPYYVKADGYAGVSAAIEFAVCNLQIEHIVVLGHAQCGGIRALMQGMNSTGDETEFIGKWVNIAASARDKVLKDLPGKPLEVQTRAVEQASILISLDNLLTFPWIRSRVEAGKLALHGWYFDMARNNLMNYNPETSSFEDMAHEEVICQG